MFSFLRWPHFLMVCALGCGGVVAYGAPQLEGKTSLPSTKGDVAAKKPLKIAVVDLDLILHESKVAQYIQKHSDTERAKFKQEAEKFESQLRQEDEELKKLQGKEKTKPEDYKKKQSIFEAHVSEVKRELNTKGRLLEDTFNRARSDVIQKLMTLLAQMAEKNGYTLVLPKNVVLLRDAEYDITDKLLEELNTQMPEVKISFDQSKPNAR